MEYQRTIGDVIHFEGEGIFSGKEIRVELYPLEENSGIVFERADLPYSPQIKLSLDKVYGLDGVVLISDGKNEILLIEHLLSLLHGLGIDNCLIKVYGGEIPLLDGSNCLLLRKVQEKGYRVLPALKKKLYLKKPFEMENGKGNIKFLPSSNLKIKAKIKFDHPVIGEQEYEFNYSTINYIKEISFARTFGFIDILQERKRKGILKGGSFSNAIIIDGEKVLNAEGLRAPDEFVRHKVLDLMGDLFATGMTLLAEVEACCSGHKLHIEALKALVQAGLVEIIEPKAITFLWVSKIRRQFF
ncbi:MAG: UDP-3-O-acyl-N-acetylglucosamine deacetylase [Caldimicrobium sp.]